MGKKRRHVSHFLVQPGDAAPAAARRLLYNEYKTISDNLEGALQGDDPCYLHDIRVATRRLRSALKLFKNKLPHPERIRQLDQSWKTLAAALSPGRDAQVWMAFLTRDEHLKKLQKDPAWPRFYALQKDVARERLEGVRHTLSGSLFRITRQDTLHYLSEDIATETIPEASPARQTAGRRMKKQHRKIMKAAVTLQKDSMESMHAFRKLCRRQRYWAEFMAPVCDKKMTHYAGHMKQLADQLGRMRDIDLHLGELKAAAEPAPDALIKLLQKDRPGREEKFRVAMKKLKKKTCQKELARMFSEMEVTI